MRVRTRIDHGARAVKVSSRAEYGLRALVDLARHYGEGYVQSHEIAARQGLPESYLNQIMASLRRAGLVASKRGPAGGHTLSRPPAQITLREAFEVLEEGAAPWWCVGVEDPNCAYLPGCGIRPIWMAMKAAAEGVLERLTLHDMIYGHAPGAE
ncbi:MAG: Rrf2 family transcriptional regulator [Armatimonadota bacterium]|nr:Rrf2 family transcriptional regulator [Armatimonadota bacterium]MDR7427772.1 Rrf2 family transcriptional regulator [Armatimonadota bacterium]MDR7470942.1 Rrf2 family transcriptional regulator [Armatimonadota bacterium]MDR7473387.1 Rrf2 family transcriptional regulator [Armatimonadota bacterium]MDR7538444.1 Rrf2 family transcriptional regulator [Armatimonadota bacterium]